MKKFLLFVGMLAAFQGTLFSQQTDSSPVELTCPLDGHRFSWPVPQRSGPNSGVDSDLCAHPVGVFALSEAVVTCPRCNYTDLRANFAATAFDEQTRDRLFAALATSGYRNVDNPMQQIPTWERSRLGWVCAKARGVKASKRADWPLLGIYSTRVEATRPASGAHRFGDPIRNAWFFAAVERRMLDETEAERRAELKLHLAMLSQRMGLPNQRERWLAAALKDEGLTPGQRLNAERFSKLVRIETSFQQELISVLSEGLAETDLPAESRTAFVYLKADTLRRLGRLQEAAIQFVVLRQSLTEPSPRREMCDYFIALLSEHLDKGASRDE